MKTHPCRYCNGTGKEPDQAIVGNILMAMRKAAKLTQKDVAAALGFESVGYLCDLEKGHRTVTMKIYKGYVAAVKQLKSKHNETSKNRNGQ